MTKVMSIHPQIPSAVLLISGLLLPAAGGLANCSDRFPENTPTRDFTLQEDGTAVHVKTGLIWSRCSMGQVLQGDACSGAATTHSFFSAAEQAKRANENNYLGFNSWRLPTVEELQSIVELHCANPAINETVFPNTPDSWYWSASTFNEFPSYGMPVDFGNGYDEIWYKITYESNPFPVRLVRSPKTFDPQALGVDSDGDGVSDALELTQATNPKLKDNNIAQDERFAAQLYRDLYLREATANELSEQVQALKTNPDRVGRVVALALAPEFQQQHLEVAILLALAINDQIPPREWLNEWRDSLHKGNTSEALVDAFVKKTALKESYLSANGQDYVIALGSQLLGRSLTPGELQEGDSLMQSMTRAEFTAYWLSSLTLKKIPVSQLVVIQVADLLTRYTLDSATLGYYSQQLDSGSITIADLLKLVLISDGYIKRFLP
ncbi:MAG: DUF1566 domain-containing protein [Methylococcales bacterium]